jgi:hypothetical protein
MDDEFALPPELREVLKVTARGFGLTNIQAIGILEGAERYCQRKGLAANRTAADEATVASLIREAASRFVARLSDPTIFDPLQGFRDTEPIDWSNTVFAIRVQYPSLEDDLGLSSGFDPFARFIY